jgi:hypothetical protein
MTSAHRGFERACRNALGFLCERFGFKAPEFEQLGREAFVRFDNGPRTVSVSWEPCAPPLVEFFYQSALTGDPPVPWVERDGVAYSRRIPRLASSEEFSKTSGVSFRPEAWCDPDEAMMEQYLVAIGRALEAVESQFLSGEESPR